MTVRVFRLLQNLRFSLEKLEARLLERLGGHPPLAPAFALQGTSLIDDQSHHNQGSLSSIFDGFLWAVPKHRRSIQRNRKRRRAVEKLEEYIPEWKFVMCEVCGHSKMRGFICGHCLIRIRQESAEIRKELFETQEENNIIPERESIVLYEDEALRPEDQGKEVVEMKKKRPFWFSRSLTE
ncbi:39S ribosomal protein L32, mitochondrial-like [Asterias rubens]|uniref:39S ribosomal protein L32, mitochondrial-like n=1 Tax=Asterias rubens TaxID=7604 RepID=UPI00145576C3|nr:39S ribosomal protein L32, mitochondrial-like [Asterias rubens]